MCVVCGCANTTATHPEQAHVAVDAATGDLHYGAGAARVSVPGMSQARAIKLEADVLGENKRIAAANRAHFAAHGVTAYNLVSSPGSGKTTLLCATIDYLKRHAPALPLAVIEGDQQTSNDADRIRATGAPAIQVNTGKGCHLDAPMVAAAFARRGLAPNLVLSAMDADVIKTYVELGMGVGIIASMAFDEERDSALQAIDAGHLFAMNLTRVAVRRGAFLRGYAYEFIRSFAPPLTRARIDQAMAQAGGSSFEI